MATQNQKPQGLPNPYAAGGLPNPYALAQADGAAASNPADEQAKLEEKKSTAKLFHQPHLIRRPQAKANAPVKKPTISRPQVSSAALDVKAAAEEPRTTSDQRSLEYYKSTADDDAAILEARAEAQREERNRKKEERKFKKMFGNWNPHQEYKVRHSTNLGAYNAIGAYQDKLDDFLGLIRSARREAARRSSEDSARRQESSPSPSKSPAPVPNRMFAPPLYDEPSTSPPASSGPSAPVPQTADEAYEHRLRLAEQRAVPSASAPQHTPPSESVPPEPAANPLFAPPPEPTPTPAPVTKTPAVVKSNKPTIDIAEQIRKAKERAAAIKAAPQQHPQAQQPPPPLPAEPPAVNSPPPPPPPPPQPPAYSATISAPPVHYSATISAPPVHYARPASDQKDDGDVQERPAKKQKTKEPPKPSKAELMMAKMGYVKGKGLGKNADGVTTHLEVKARKDQGNRKQIREDFGEDSARTIKSAQVFDITGGLRAQGEDHGRFGEPSRVVVSWGCIDGVDLAQDAERDDGGIRQEMGDSFNKKFGPVERIHVDLQSDSRPVYIQFKDPLCALNAVNRFHEGYQFRGRNIKAQFYDELKFNALIYDQ